MGSKRTCPICRKGVAQLLRVFFAGASMNNEPLAAPPPVEADRSRSVCRPVGALLVPVNFISDLRGPRGNVPIPEPRPGYPCHTQALCDRSHADQEILAEIEHVENVWMEHCPDPGELSVEEAIDVMQISVTEDVYNQRETVDGFIKIFGKGMGGVGETAFTTAPSIGPTTNLTQRES